MIAISRAVAQSAGLRRYFTGKPCAHGHVAERIVSSKSCAECASLRDRVYKESNAELLREKSRAWYQSNKQERRSYYLARKDEYKERADRRYRKKRDEILLQQKLRSANDPAKIKEKNRAYRAGNPDKVAATMRSNYIQNRATILARLKARYREDPSKARAKAAIRRARRLRAVPGWFHEFDAFVWAEAADLARKRSDLTGFAWVSDHMIPLAARLACGLHVWNNCQVIPGWLNLAKNNKFTLTEPGEWIRHLR